MVDLRCCGIRVVMVRLAATPFTCYGLAIVRHHMFVHAASVTPLAFVVNLICCGIYGRRRGLLQHCVHLLWVCDASIHLFA